MPTIKHPVTQIIVHTLFMVLMLTGIYQVCFGSLDNRLVFDMIILIYIIQD